MSHLTKLIISLVVTAIATMLTTIVVQGDTVSLFDLRIAIAFFVATFATAIIVGSMSPSADASTVDSPASSVVKASADGPREHGTVKWFNVSKGFGFIIRENDEEIFVHFRSIRGEGRRSLRDGQKVSFVVAQSDKGPQAEDVVGE